MGKELNLAQGIGLSPLGGIVLERSEWQMGEGFGISMCRGMGVSLAEDYTAPLSARHIRKACL